ncbi:lysozyme inhibitor LprI family protein [Lysobacter capsici]|uniref:lysozyme inhibitor LprI family protein n=1 Tax=Lysobacter capsici TaxID=435897 RepID=UPI00207A19FC|nr:lysozyme inhibitor LprI family protein [Lysobacter capsici]
MRLLSVKTTLCLILVTGCSAPSRADKAVSTTTNAESVQQKSRGANDSRGQEKPIAESITAPQNKGDQNVLRPSYDKCLDATGGVTPEIQDCIAEEYDFQDDRLNKVYQSLLAKLPKEDQEALRVEQRKWVSKRDAECEIDSGAGQGQRLEANDCLLEMTAKRASELEQR